MRYVQPFSWWWLKTDSRAAPVLSEISDTGRHSCCCYCFLYLDGRLLGPSWKIHSRHLSLQREERARRSRPALAALFVTFSMQCTVNITSNNQVPVIPIAWHTIVFTRCGGSVAMEPTLGSVCVFTWVSVFVCILILYVHKPFCVP